MSTAPGIFCCCGKYHLFPCLAGDLYLARQDYDAVKSRYDIHLVRIPNLVQAVWNNMQTMPVGTRYSYYNNGDYWRKVDELKSLNLAQMPWSDVALLRARQVDAPDGEDGFAIDLQYYATIPLDFADAYGLIEVYDMLWPYPSCTPDLGGYVYDELFRRVSLSLDTQIYIHPLSGEPESNIADYGAVYISVDGGYYGGGFWIDGATLTWNPVNSVLENVFDPDTNPNPQIAYYSWSGGLPDARQIAAGSSNRIIIHRIINTPALTNGVSAPPICNMDELDRINGIGPGRGIFYGGEAHAVFGASSGSCVGGEGFQTSADLQAYAGRVVQLDDGVWYAVSVLTSATSNLPTYNGFTILDSADSCWDVC